MLNRKARVRKARKSTHWSDRAAAARSDLGSGTLALERTKSLQERNERAQKIANLKQANKDLYTLFTDMDTDNDGCLDTEEVYCRMTKMRGDVSEEFVEQMMSMVDSDGDGHIDFEEFVLASAAQRSTVLCLHSYPRWCWGQWSLQSSSVPPLRRWPFPLSAATSA